MKTPDWKILALGLALCGCSAMSHTHEKLATPDPPIDKSWTVRCGETDKVRRCDWEAPGGEQFYSVLVLQLPHLDLDAFRADLDKGDLCKPVESQSLDDSPVHGRPRRIWFFRCERDGKSMYNLSMLIAGETAAFHLNRHWASKPDPSEIDAWKNWLESVYLCDPRSKGAERCPQSGRPSDSSATAPLPGRTY